MDTLLSNEDVELAVEGLWEGTHQLNSSSKMGVEPRLLLQVTYTEDASHVGDLHRELELDVDNEESVDIRDIQEAVIDVDDLLSSLETYRDSIQGISGRVDRRVRVKVDGENGGPDAFTTALDESVGESKTDLSTV